MKGSYIQGQSTKAYWNETSVARKSTVYTLRRYSYPEADKRSKAYLKAYNILGVDEKN